MAIDPEWTPSSLTAFTGITPGTPTAAQGFEFWNDEDGTAGADPILNGSFRVVAKLTSGGDWKSEGLAALDNRWFQIQIIGGLGGLGLDVAVTGWINVGAGRRSALPARIESQEGVDCEVRMDVPSWVTQPDDLDFEIVLDSDIAVPLATGVYDAGGQGILDGIGDDTRPASFFEPVTIVPAGTADNTVTVGDARWRDADGVPHVELTHVETITDVDGDASTITGTEGYKITVSYGAGATVTLTKGSKADPGSTATAPDAPSGEKLWGVILVTLTGAPVVIEAADITQDPSAYPETAAVVTASALDQTYSGRLALVGGRKVEDRQNAVISHTDAVTDRPVWILPDGTMEEGATSPEPGSELVHLVTTAGSAVTGTTDRRRFAGPEHVASFDHATAISGAVILGTVAHPGNRPLHLRPMAGSIVILLHDADPSALGHSSGSWAFEIKVGGTTIYTSSGADDRRPDIAYDATSNLAIAANGGGDPLAEVLVWNPGELLEFSITGVPAGGSSAAGASGTMRWRERP